MAGSILSQLRLHARFYLPAVIGLAAGLASYRADPAIRLVIAGDVFFALHIAAMVQLASSTRHGKFRERASEGDEGLVAVALITLTAVALGVGSIVSLLIHPDGLSPLQVILAVASVPLGWFMLHTVFSFHYAHAYYGQRGEGPPDKGGLRFPGGGDPQAWDFLYYGFVVGMTAQVSDAVVLTPRMRRLTLGHSVVSFFFNTVILALAVNGAVTLAG